MAIAAAEREAVVEKRSRADVDDVVGRALSAEDRSATDSPPEAHVSAQ
jgi:hypothetical protein